MKLYMVKAMVERTVVNTVSGGLVLTLAIFLLHNWFQAMNVSAEEVRELKTEIVAQKGKDTLYEERFALMSKQLDIIDQKIDKVLVRIK